MWRIFFKNRGTEGKKRLNFNKHSELRVPLGVWDTVGQEKKLPGNKCSLAASLINYRSLSCDRRLVAGLAEVECLERSVGASEDIPVSVGRAKYGDVGFAVFVIVAGDRHVDV